MRVRLFWRQIDPRAVLAGVLLSIGVIVIALLPWGPKPDQVQHTLTQGTALQAGVNAAQESARKACERVMIDIGPRRHTIPLEERFSILQAFMEGWTEQEPPTNPQINEAARQGCQEAVYR